MNAEDRWRLILSNPQSGSLNMATDEAILESVIAGEALPTLRLYAWEPACLSLGYAQPQADADLERLRRMGWDRVRRPTGGRAILHVDELTYSIAAPEGHPLLAGGVLPSYQRLSQGLLAALAELSIEAVSESTVGEARVEPTNPICFQVPSAYEITVGGRKLIGSAQVRRKGGVLQHGSLPLAGDIGRLCAGLRFESEEDRLAAAEALRRRATTVEACLGRPVDWQEAAQRFADGFRRQLLQNLDEQPLSDRERSRAAVLVRDRYANPDWTGRL